MLRNFTLLMLAAMLAIANPSARQRPSPLLPVHFETDPAHPERYLVLGAGYRMSIGASDTRLWQGSASIRTILVGANRRAHFEALDPINCRVNYVQGSTSSRWRYGVKAYGRLAASEAYPGIDLMFHADHVTEETRPGLEFDFIVKPGANPSKISMRVDGAEWMRVSPEGDLVITASGQQIRWKRPNLYQEVAGVRQPIEGGFRVHGNRIHFWTAAYDPKHPLVIDPMLSYSTYFGGNGTEVPRGIAMDASGNVYIAGITSSQNLPVTKGAFQTAFGGFTNSVISGDVFVAKYNSSGIIQFVTYLGGEADDVGTALAVDASGNVYITGYTNSRNFPTTPGVKQRQFAGFGGNLRTTVGDAFVAKLSSDGGTLIYSTYLGGRLDDAGTAIAVDSAGNAYVTGFSLSTDFPVTTGAFQTTMHGAGGQPSTNHFGIPLLVSGDAFVAKLNPTASDLVFSTYVGGSQDDTPTSIAIDATGNVYIAGMTISSNYPTTTGALQTQYGGDEPLNFFFAVGDGFVTKLNPTGTNLVYSTYLGGTGADAIRALVVDSTGNAYVTGATTSQTFPTTAGVLQNRYHGPLAPGPTQDHLIGDAFVAKLNPQGSGLVFSTYLGGSLDEEASSLALDAAGNIFVAGMTYSKADFPITPDAAQKVYGGEGPEELGGDGFVVELNPTATTLLYGTFLGGSLGDWIGGVAVDQKGNAWVTGFTASSDYPVTPNAAQKTFGGPNPRGSYFSGDSFLAKYSGFLVQPPPPSINHNGIVNNASFASGSLPVAPGSIAAIFGSNLTDGSSCLAPTCGPQFNNGQLNTTLAGAQVTVGGIPAPIFYASPLQLGIQIPLELSGTSAGVQVSVGGQNSSSQNISIAAVVPGVFTTTQDGKGIGAITHVDGSQITNQSPAHPGEVVILYATGFGKVDPPVATGRLPTGPSKTVTPVTVSIDGVAVTPDFAGLSGCCVGENQVNVKIPSGTRSADNIAVVLSIGGAQSNPVTISVRP